MQIQQPIKKVSSNSEYFTVVFQKGSKGVAEGFYFPISKLDANAKIKISPQQFYQLIIQTTYLVFTASRQKLQLKISLEEDLLYDSREQKKSPSQLTIHLRYEILQESTTPHPAKRLTISLLDGILALKKKFSSLGQTTLFNQFVTDFQLIKQLSLNSQKEFFWALQETELFRRFAFLLKIKNCMLMNVMKTESGLMEKFWAAQKKEVEQVGKYKEAKENKQNEKLLECNRVIGGVITQFFTSDLGELNKVCRVEERKDEFLKLYLLEKKLGFASFVKSKGKDMIQPESDFKRSELEYVIQYEQERNQVSVWLITDLAMLVQINDFLLYQCNKLTFDCTQISLDFYERGAQGTQKTKMLSLKCDQLLTSKQPVLQTILLMIDRTMIIYKIIYPHLNRVMNRDHQLPDSVFKKINHYLGIFKACSKVIYSPPTNE